jgi:hypothetical protein
LSMATVLNKVHVPVMNVVQSALRPEDCLNGRRRNRGRCRSRGPGGDL